MTTSIWGGLSRSLGFVCSAVLIVLPAAGSAQVADEALLRKLSTELRCLAGGKSAMPAAPWQMQASNSVLVKVIVTMDPTNIGGLGNLLSAVLSLGGADPALSRSRSVVLRGTVDYWPLTADRIPRSIPEQRFRGTQVLVTGGVLVLDDIGAIDGPFLATAVLASQASLNRGVASVPQ